MLGSYILGELPLASWGPIATGWRQVCGQPSSWVDAQAAQDSWADVDKSGGQWVDVPKDAKDSIKCKGS